jgi:hypothetical protein
LYVIVPFCSSGASEEGLNLADMAALRAISSKFGFDVVEPFTPGFALITFPFLSTVISTTTFPSS